MYVNVTGASWDSVKPFVQFYFYRFFCCWFLLLSSRSDPRFTLIIVICHYYALKCIVASVSFAKRKQTKFILNPFSFEFLAYRSFGVIHMYTRSISDRIRVPICRKQRIAQNKEKRWCIWHCVIAHNISYYTHRV